LKLLIHTQYFPPEVGAPQNRLFELALRLQQLGVEVSILTAMPNYPKMEIHVAYKGKKYAAEEMEGLKVHRSAIYVSTSKSLAKRLLNYFSFVWSSYWIGRSKLDKHYDFILCESPPLFLGIASYLLTKNKSAKFIFNVSDLWPESAEKLGLVSNKFFLKLAQRLEEFLYKKAHLITGQTQGIVKNIQTRFPKKEVYWLPNGVDLAFYDPDKIQSNWRKENNYSNTDKLLLYAGIIGHAQGLEIILKTAKMLEGELNLKFLILGSGPCKKELIVEAKRLQLTNLRFLETVDKEKMPEIIKAIDVALIPLKKLDLFKGAIPSKIFENLAMKVPLVLGVEGEAKKLFIDEANAGLFYEPDNAEAMAEAIKKISKEKKLIQDMGENGRKYVTQKFNRDRLAESFFKKLKEYR